MRCTCHTTGTVTTTDQDCPRHGNEEAQLIGQIRFSALAYHNEILSDGAIAQARIELPNTASINDIADIAVAITNPR